MAQDNADIAKFVFGEVEMVVAVQVPVVLHGQRFSAPGTGSTMGIN